MTRVLDRMRTRRIGLIGLVLLALLVIVLAHSMLMGAGHGDEAACGSCVVVVATGLAAVVALRAGGTAPAPSRPVFRSTFVRAASHVLWRPPPRRFTVLRL